MPHLTKDPSHLCPQGHTDILVGVKAEMGTPKLEKPEEGYLEFFVDWSVSCRCFMFLKSSALKHENWESKPLVSGAAFTFSMSPFHSPGGVCQHGTERSGQKSRPCLGNLARFGLAFLVWRGGSCWAALYPAVTRLSRVCSNSRKCQPQAVRVFGSKISPFPALALQRTVLGLLGV